MSGSFVAFELHVHRLAECVSPGNTSVLFLFVPVVTDLAKSFTHDLLPFFRFSQTSNFPPLG